MRRIFASILIVLTLAGAVYFGWQWWTHGRYMESTDNAFIHADISSSAPDRGLCHRGAGG
jgi:membrane fusion protein (multidrug efflux system)